MPSDSSRGALVLHLFLIYFLQGGFELVIGTSEVRTVIGVDVDWTSSSSYEFSYRHDTRVRA